MRTLQFTHRQWPDGCHQNLDDEYTWYTGQLVSGIVLLPYPYLLPELRFVVQTTPICLRSFKHSVRRAASRAVYTASNYRVIKMATMAIPTANSVSVKAAE